MIPAGVEIFVAVAPIDLRWGFDRLAGLANEQLGRSARSGALLVFFGKRKSAVKVCSSMEAGCACFTSGWTAERSESRKRCVPTARASNSASANSMTCSMASTWSRSRHVVAGECTKSLDCRIRTCHAVT